MSELIRVSKKAADAWRGTDAYHQAAMIIDMLIDRVLELESELDQAERVIWECEEAFSDRCHDDYAEAAIDAWNRRVGGNDNG